MTTEERLNAIERNQQIISDNLNGLVNMVGKLRINTDADISGTRQSVANITPFTMIKTAYVGDTKAIFEDVPDGNLTVYFDNSYKINRDSATKRLTVTFEPLKKVTNITISIL